jgi:thioesterase domain-containing protein
MQTSNGNIASVLLPRSLTNAAKEFSNQQGVTLYTTALAVFKMLLWQSTGQSDVGIGTQVAGRNQIELEDLVGVFINTLLLRTEVPADVTFGDLLRRVQDTVTEALANQETPFERLVEILRPKRDLSRNPLFSVNFIYQRAFIKNCDFAGISLIDIPSRSPGAMYDLNFFMVERIEGWRWSCEYNTDLYSKNTIERVLANFQKLLQAAIENPERSVEDLQGSVARAAHTTLEDKTALNLKPSTVGDPVRANIEAALSRMWEELLQTSSINRADDFFDLGGHSLLATRLLARIEKVFGRKIGLATLFQSSTVEKLAAVLVGELDVTGISALQPQGTRSPFFWINGWPTIRNLAVELGLDQPFYSVNLPDDHDLTVPYAVSEIADRYLKIIRQAQPYGPYMLGGWCRAGLIAYEIAQKLKADGETVKLVGLFDTWSPTYLARYSKSEARHARRQLRMERFWFHLGVLRRKSPKAAYDYMVYHLRNVEDRYKVASLRFKYRLKTKFGLPVDRKVYTETEMIFLATNEYRPKPLDSRVVLFRFDEYKDWKYWDPNLGWDEYLKAGFDVHEVPGRHNSEYFFVGPHLPEVARQMAAAIEAASQNQNAETRAIPQLVVSPV